MEKLLILIDDYVDNNDNSIAFISMGQLNYLSALKYVDVVIGNSSSGLLEAPSFKIVTIDIGDRQKGRIKAASVISCLPTQDSISGALDKAFSKDFQCIINEVENPYGDGGASKNIVELIHSFPMDGILKKEFYNLNNN